MASPSTVITLGYGSFGSVNLVPTLGYGSAGATLVGQWSNVIAVHGNESRIEAHGNQSRIEVV